MTDCEIIVLICTLVALHAVSLSELLFCMFYSYLPLIVSYDVTRAIGDTLTK